MGKSKGGGKGNHVDARLLWAALQLFPHFRRSNDVWHALEFNVPIDLFGRGSIRDFAWYCEPDCGIRVDNIDQLCRFLLGCEYMDDMDLFSVSDCWQHPANFAKIRQGDCEDFALWAWCKLAALDMRAEFVTGVWNPDGAPDLHAWIILHPDDQPYVLETVAVKREQMLLPLQDIRHEYIPHFSVDHAGIRRVYAGILSSY